MLFVFLLVIFRLWQRNTRNATLDDDNLEDELQTLREALQRERQHGERAQLATELQQLQDIQRQVKDQLASLRAVVATQQTTDTDKAQKLE